MSNEVIDRVTRLVQAFDSRVQAAPADTAAHAVPDTKPLDSREDIAKAARLSSRTEGRMLMWISGRS